MFTRVFIPAGPFVGDGMAILYSTVPVCETMMTNRIGRSEEAKNINQC